MMLAGWIALTNSDPLTGLVTSPLTPRIARAQPGVERPGAQTRSPEPLRVPVCELMVVSAQSERGPLRAAGGER